LAFTNQAKQKHHVFQPIMKDAGFNDARQSVLRMERSQRCEHRLALLPAALVALYHCASMNEALDRACEFARKIVTADLLMVVLRDPSQTCRSCESSPAHTDSPELDAALLHELEEWLLGVNKTTYLRDLRDLSAGAAYKPPGAASQHFTTLLAVTCADHPGFAVLAMWKKEFHPDEYDIAILESIVSGTLVHIERLNAMSALQESETRFRTLVEDTAQVIWEADPDGRSATPSGSWQAHATMDVERWRRFGWQSIVHPEDLADVEKQWRSAIAARRPVNNEFRIRDTEGQWRWTHSRAAPIYRADGTICKWVGMNIDITERKEAETRLRESEEFNRISAEAAQVGTWYIDLQADQLVISPKKAELLGLPHDRRQISVEEWKSWVCPEDAPKVMHAIDNVVKSRTAIDVEYRINLPGQDERWLYSRGTVISDGDRPVRRLYGATLDITKRKKAVETIWRQANFDPLTGLPNRRLFHDRLDHAIKSAHRHEHKLALLFLDLDRFKQVNDLLGHDTGDKLLMHVAGRLSECVRESDTVARLSGDEFTIILTDLPRESHVENVTQNILVRLNAPFHLGSGVAHISTSIGAALYPDDGLEASDLMRKADQAMYSAKASGRNCFRYFTPSMDEVAHLHVTLQNELRQALASNQLRIVYQPVVALKDNRIVKAEALLRWHHPQLGNIEPAVFIPLAEESGLINDIGDWVFQQAAMTAKKWSTESETAIHICINKSPAQFLRQRSMDSWVGYLKRIGLPGNSITVEITEGLLMNNSTAITDELLRYRDAGIMVAIDDFGTGYSSMAYLKKFHVDFLKIDQSFVHDIDCDHTHRTIAESIIVMAHKLGMKVIAEGVETEEQRSILAEAGCDYGQGFLFCKPVCLSELESMLRH
jgi:diguanylate cyclase (GGDEF)-like protein/PAS domain S-box-containing protein